MKAGNQAVASLTVQIYRAHGSKQQMPSNRGGGRERGRGGKFIVVQSLSDSAVELTICSSGLILEVHDWSGAEEIGERGPVHKIRGGLDAIGETGDAVEGKIDIIRAEGLSGEEH